MSQILTINLEITRLKVNLKMICLREYATLLSFVTTSQEI